MTEINYAKLKILINQSNDLAFLVVRKGMQHVCHGQISMAVVSTDSRPAAFQASKPSLTE